MAAAATSAQVPDLNGWKTTAQFLSVSSLEVARGTNLAGPSRWTQPQWNGKLQDQGPSLLLILHRWVWTIVFLVYQSKKSFTSPHSSPLWMILLLSPYFYFVLLWEPPQSLCELSRSCTYPGDGQSYFTYRLNANLIDLTRVSRDSTKGQAKLPSLHWTLKGTQRQEQEVGTVTSYLSLQLCWRPVSIFTYWGTQQANFHVYTLQSAGIRWFFLSVCSSFFFYPRLQGFA